MIKNKLVGFSVSFCIRDIAKGIVPVEKVRIISAGTKIETQAQLENVITQYNNCYWKEFPEAEIIFRKLWNEGKIYQPRIFGKRPKYSKHGLWKSCV